MRINLKTTGTMATWFVNLSNQCKGRHRKWLWNSTLCQTVQSFWNIIAWYRLVQEIASSLSCLISAVHAPLRLLLWHFINGQILTMQVMTSSPTMLLCHCLTLTSKEQHTERKETKNNGMQWYCKAQLFTSHQAQRSQRHNMSQHAKQCKLEHPRFPETKRHKEKGKKSFQSDESKTVTVSY